MKITFTWHREDTGVHKLKVNGKWIVADVCNTHAPAHRAPIPQKLAADTKWRCRCHLPGIKTTLATIKELPDAKARVEGAVRKWFDALGEPHEYEIILSNNEGLA